MNPTLAPEEEAFRQEVVEFLASREQADAFFWHEVEHDAAVRRLYRELGEKGWLSLAWPVEAGGGGLPPMYEFILWNEMAYARAARPPLGSGIVANLNTDMFLPLNPLRQLLVNGLEESDLADDVRRAAGKAGIEVITDPEPERNAFVRSDQFSFIRRGIPALSLKGGFALGTPEHERILRWRQERYHGVEDEVTQPVDRQAAADFNRLFPEVILEVADRATRPAWYPTSPFRPEHTSSH